MERSLWPLEGNHESGSSARCGAAGESDGGPEGPKPTRNYQQPPLMEALPVELRPPPLSSGCLSLEVKLMNSKCGTRFNL